MANCSYNKILNNYAVVFTKVQACSSVLISVDIFILVDFSAF